MSFRRLTLSLLLVSTTVVAAAAAGCGGHSSSSSADNGRVAGHWQISGATIFAGIPGVTYIDLDKSGSALLSATESKIGAVECGQLIFAVLNDKIVSIEFPGGTVNYYRYTRSGSTLSLTDAFGQQTNFTSVASIPAASTCVALPASTPIYFPSTNSPYLGYGPHFTGSGTRLWYFRQTYDASWYDVATGTTGGSLFSTVNYRFIQGAQDDTLWNGCQCGNENDIERLDTAGNLIDTVTTSDPQIGVDIRIDSAAFDGTDLWLSGSLNSGTRDEMWLKIDSGAEPDLLLGSGLIPGYGSGLAIRNGHILTLDNDIGATIVEIDPATGAPVKSYLMPPGPQYWQGLAVANDTVYSLSADDYNHPVAYPLTGL